MVLAPPTRYPEPDGRRNIKAEQHLAPPQVRHKLLPLLTAHPQGGAAQLADDHRRVFGFLIKRKQERRSPNVLVLIIDGQLHGIIVNTHDLIGITRRHIVDYGGVVESGLLGQCRDGEFFDVESRPVGA